MPAALAYQPFHVEHVVAIKHGGNSGLANLALACQNCNLHKGPNLTGIDPETGETTPLFHPRTDVWEEHFAQRGYVINGLTPKGRATIRVLAMNDDDQLAIREALGLDGSH